MQKLFNYYRYAACIPAGYLGGRLVSSTVADLSGNLLGQTWLAVCVGSILCGASLAITMYEVGMLVAPDRSELSRILMLLCNHVLFVATSCQLFQCLYDYVNGDLVAGRSDKWWFCFVMLSIGKLVGCGCVFLQERVEVLAEESQSAEFVWHTSTDQSDSV